jgi:hypothetical protein
MANGSTVAAAPARWSDTPPRSASATSVGGIRVMWVGIWAAVVSPTDVR